MADIDGRLLGLVGTTLRSPLEPLAQRALARIETAEAADPDDDPLARPREEGADRRALRQLKLLDEVVGGALTLELEICDRAIELSRDIDRRLRSEREGAGLSNVIVADVGTPIVDADGVAGPGRLRVVEVGLFEERRRAALGRTMAAWRRAIDAVGASILGDPGGAFGDR